ncbi:MAG: flagellar basal body L-ring protein FlgH [Kofleriaceae bacterium]
MKSITSILVATLVATGCTSHIAPYKPKKRHFDAGEFGERNVAQDGSLYAEGQAGLLEDPTAGRVGDILLVRIDEKDLASNNADTKLDKSDDTSYGVPAAFGFVAALKAKYPDVDPAKLFATSSSQKFSGQGSTSRSGTVNATLSVRVRQILPSGDLFIEGTKVVMVGAEEKHIYVSGVVRRIDISEDNSVLSSRIADAEIEYAGRGDISDTQRRGWASRALSKIWPF